MEAYPYETIRLNQRTVSIRDIEDGKIRPNDSFESAVVQFVREWLGGQDTFEQVTSGSTGKPKKISIRRDQMTASADMTRIALSLRGGDTALICLDPTYIAGKMMLVRSFMVGMRMVVLTPTANPFKSLASADEVDFTALVPMQLKTILGDHTAQQLNNVRSIIVGGGELDRKTEDLLQTYACRCIATYGMTETISHVALRALNGPDRSSLFRALPGITIRQDERRCCVVSWPVLDHDVVTNDIIEMEGPGYFRWLGRWDNVINSGGVKIVPEELESKIYSLMQEFYSGLSYFIAGEHDERLGERVVLAIEGNCDDARIQVLWNALQRRLPSFEVPREIRFGSFRYTPTGKINRDESMLGLRSVRKPSQA